MIDTCEGTCPKSKKAYEITEHILICAAGKIRTMAHNGAVRNEILNIRHSMQQNELTCNMDNGKCTPAEDNLKPRIVDD